MFFGMVVTGLDWLFRESSACYGGLRAPVWIDTRRWNLGVCRAACGAMGAILVLNSVLDSCSSTTRTCVRSHPAGLTHLLTAGLARCLAQAIDTTARKRGHARSTTSRRSGRGFLVNGVPSALIGYALCRGGPYLSSNRTVDVISRRQGPEQPSPGRRP